MKEQNIKKARLIVMVLAALTGILKFLIALPLIAISYPAEYAQLTLSYLAYSVFFVAVAVIYSYIIFWALNRAKAFDLNTNSILTLVTVTGYYLII